jgi:hypothetical protein
MAARLRPITIAEVIDGAALRASLSAVFAEHGDGARENVKALLLEALLKGRDIGRERLEAGENGLAVARFTIIQPRTSSALATRLRASALPLSR